MSTATKYNAKSLDITSSSKLNAYRCIVNHLHQLYALGQMTIYHPYSQRSIDINLSITPPLSKSQISSHQLSKQKPPKDISNQSNLSKSANA